MVFKTTAFSRSAISPDVAMLCLMQALNSWASIKQGACYIGHLANAKPLHSRGELADCAARSGAKDVQSSPKAKAERA